MSERSTDPGSLKGAALTRWYSRSPSEIEREREVAASRRHQEFFYGTTSSKPNVGLPGGTRTPDRAKTMVSAPRADQTIAYGALRGPAPSDQELAELRRQQAAFAETTRKIDLQNSWFAAPALAAPLLAMGLEAGAAWAARGALTEIEQAPLQFLQREPHLRVGDNYATRAGRRAHAALKERLAQKPDWKYEPKLPREGQRPLRPDIATPPRDPTDPLRRKYMELKPNSPSGRAAGARAVERYREVTKDPVRLLFYNLKDFI